MAYDSGTGPCPPRRAFCILQAWPKADVVEAVVDLSRGRGQVISWKEVSMMPVSVRGRIWLCELMLLVAAAARRASPVPP